MGDSEKGGETRVLERLAPDDKRVVTLNVRASQIVVFWSAIDLAVPIDPGWYFHAASVAGKGSPQNGERRLYDAPFDPADKSVRWEHAKVGNYSKVDLFLDPGRRYMFYITPQAAGNDELVRNHRPWPFIFRAPKSSNEPAIIGFQSWTPFGDCHREQKEATAPKATGSDPSMLGFGPVEHDSTASASTNDGKSVQMMVDAWAASGMIEGGAMMTTSGPVSNWTIQVAREGSSTDSPDVSPTSPYGNAPMGSWHYVIPAADIDGSRWTATSLKTAISEGRAAALTVGQAIMLGGDLFGKPQDMESETDRWTTPYGPVIPNSPQNIMKVYWDARAWVKFAIYKTGSPGSSPWLGYEQKYGVVYQMFDVLTKNTDDLGPSTVDDMIDVADFGKELAPDSVGKKMWAKFLTRVLKVDALVDLLHKAVGPTRFSEVHFLVQALGYPGGTSLDWIQSRVPRLDGVDIESVLYDGGFTREEIQYLKKTGPNDEFVQFASTNGRYSTLALHNETHFSDGGRNAMTFGGFHAAALKLVTDHANDQSGGYPIPARAVFYSAFGCHFLTDSFSASHMRVPRSRLGPFASKAMHDIDGLVGLWVMADGGAWRAYGDGYLRATDLEKNQTFFLSHDGRGLPVDFKSLAIPVDTDPDANFQHAAAAVGSAIKQLHYQALASVPASQMVQKVLEYNGPGPSPGDDSKMRNENLAPGRAGNKSFVDNLRMTDNERILFVQSLIPVPWGADEGPLGNIPPLYSAPKPPKAPELLTDGTYKVAISEAPDQSVMGKVKGLFRGYTKYAGFTLWAYWGRMNQEMARMTEKGDLSQKLDNFYYMIKFFQSVEGLDDYMDKSLLDIYNKLPRLG